MVTTDIKAVMEAAGCPDTDAQNRKRSSTLGPWRKLCLLVASCIVTVEKRGMAYASDLRCFSFPFEDHRPKTAVQVKQFCRHHAWLKPVQ